MNRTAAKLSPLAAAAFAFAAMSATAPIASAAVVQQHFQATVDLVCTGSCSAKLPQLPANQTLDIDHVACDVLCEVRLEVLGRHLHVVIDDDDDLATRSEALKKAEKQRMNREADDAFKKAAAADGTYQILMTSSLSNAHFTNGFIYSRPPHCNAAAQIVVVRLVVQKGPQRAADRPDQGQAWRGEQFRV